MNSRIYSDRGKSGDYQSTFLTWIYLLDSKDLMTLFSHDEVQTITIEDGKIKAEHYDQQSVEAQIPSGQWVWVVSWHDFDSFGLHVQGEDGKVYRDGFSKVSAIDKSYTTSSKVEIAQDFSGYIRGMKLYKTIPKTFIPQKFNSEDETSTDAIFYFRFQPDGFFEEDTSQLKLKLLISGRSRYSSYALNGRFQGTQISMQNILTKQAGDVYKYGSLEWDTMWDGTTCQDEKKRLFFETKGYARSRIMTIKEEYQDLSVEFWFKSEARNAGSRTLFTILRNGDPMLTITKNANDALICHPFYDLYGSQLQNSIQYYDFDNSDQGWHHVSCIIDSKTQAWGTLFKLDSQTENSYLNHFDQPPFEIKSSSRYDLVLNGDKFFENGMDNTYFADLRIWKTDRTRHQIKEYRNQVLDFSLESGLFAAYQLLGGGDQIEYDLASLNNIDFTKNQAGTSIFTNKLTFSREQWKPDSEFLMCPLFTYVSYLDKNCQRDGLSELDLVVRKDSKWYIDSKYSHFVDVDLREDFMEKFTFEWTISSMIPSDQKFPAILSSQQTKSSLEFDLDQITPGTIYLLKFLVTDTFQRQQAPISKELRFEPQSCIKFFDKSSGLSFVEIDFDQSKGSEDLSLQFITEVSCNQESIYQLSRVSYSVDFIDYTPPFGVSIQNNQLVLKKQAQDYLSVDTDIIVILRASWYSRLDYSIVYKMRFNSKVKLEVSASTQIVPLGQILQLFTNKTYIINYSGNDQGAQWQVDWTCPKTSLCPADTSSKTLKIPYKNFENSGLLHWKKYTIQAESTSFFIQGDGSISASSSIDVIWIPFYPDAKIIGEDYISVDQVLALEIDTNGIAQDKITFKWSVYPKVDEKFFFNGDDKHEFFIEPNVLLENTQYEISVEIILRENKQAFWQGKKYVYLNPTPADGKIVITPFRGIAMDTIFTVETSDWIVRHEPAQYQFMYQNSNGEYSVITPFTSSPRFTSSLPPTKKLIVKVKDSKGTIMTGFTTVFSQFQNELQTLESHSKIFNQSQSQRDTTIRLKYYSLISNNFNKFSSFKGFYTSKIQSSNMITYLSSLRSKTDFVIESGISIFCTITFSDNLYDDEQSILMLDTIQDYLSHSSRIKQDQPSIFTSDLTLQSSILKIQSNILRGLRNRVEKQEALNSDFEDQTINNVTSRVRNVTVALEKYLTGRTLVQVDQIKAQTFVNETDERGLRVNSTERGTYVWFGLNPFLGSGYQDDQGIVQEVVSDSTIFFAFDTPSNVNVTFDFILQSDRFDQDFEKQITHCVSFNESQNFSQCQTIISQTFVACQCSGIESAFITISRDEFHPPLSEAQGNFDFKNWASFIMFTYLMLFFIFGMILSQNSDQSDIAKMNDFEQGSGIENSEIQFPLSALALKRQVQIMNFAHDKLTYGTLFIIFLTQFHPFMTFKYRFDPSMARQDRFLLLFAKISIINFGSFWFFRNLDIEVDGIYTFPWDQLMMPFICIGAFSFLLLPVPRFISHLFEIKYLLTELPDNFEDTGHFFGISPDDLDNTGNVEPALNDNGQIDQGDGPKQDHSLPASPHIPLKYLFQLSAFSLEYLSKKGDKRFPFLTQGQSVIGQMLMKVEELPKKEIEMAPVEPKKKEKKKKRRVIEPTLEQFEDRDKSRLSFINKEEVKIQAGSAEEVDMSEGYTPQKPTDTSRIFGQLDLTNRPLAQIDSQASLEKNFYEGGEDSDSDPEEPQNKEFIEDYQNTKIRVLLYLIIAGLQFSLLAMYSMESIHSRGGQYIWVGVSFGAQIIGFFITQVLHILLVTFIVYKNKDNKPFLSKYFYDQLVLLEDYFYVQKFQNKF